MTDTTSKWIPASPRPTRPLAPPPSANNNTADPVEEESGDDISVEHTETLEPDEEALEEEVRVEEDAVEEDAAPSAPPPVVEVPPIAAKDRIKPGTVVRRGIRIFAVIVIAFGLFAFVLSGLAQGRTQVGLQRKFRAELTSNAAPVGGAIPSGVPVAMMEIRGIGLHEAVVEGSRSSQLRKGPGHVLGTPLPGQPGNAVIAGRRTMYGGPFRDLGSLHPGNRIHVTTGEGSSTYRVTSVQTLGVSDGSFVQDHDDNRLTLFTTDSPWAANGRLVVTATMLGNPFPPTVLQRTLDADGLGLTGERDSAPNVLVWLELLAVAALLATFVRSRWSAARTWLVFAPAIALLVWLFFESVVRLLPATL
jgi:sortase A